MTTPLLLFHQSLQGIGSDGPLSSRSQPLPFSASDEDRLSVLDSSSSLRASLWTGLAEAASRGRIPGKLLRRAGEELVYALRLATSLMANQSTICSVTIAPWLSSVSKLLWRLGANHVSGSADNNEELTPSVLRNPHSFDAYGEDFSAMEDEDDIEGVFSDTTNVQTTSDQSTMTFKSGRSGTSVRRLEDAIPVANAALVLALTICDNARDKINGALGESKGDDELYSPCAVLSLAHASVRLLLSAVNALPNGRKALTLLLNHSVGGKGKDIAQPSTLSLLLSLRDRSILDTETRDSSKGKIHLGLVIDDIEKLITISCFSRDVLINFGPQSLLRANSIVQYAVLGNPAKLSSSTSATSTTSLTKRPRPADEKVTGWKEAKPALTANEHFLFDSLFFGLSTHDFSSAVRAGPFIFAAYIRMRQTAAIDDARLSLVDSIITDGDNAVTAKLLSGKKRARSSAGVINSESTPLDVMQSLHQHKDFAFATEILACLIGMNNVSGDSDDDDSDFFPFMSPNKINIIDLCTRLRSIAAMLTVISESGAYSIHDDAAPYPQTSVLKLVTRWIKAALKSVSRLVGKTDTSYCISALRALGASVVALLELNHAVVLPHAKEIISDVVSIGASIVLTSSTSTDVVDLVSAVLKSFVSVYSRLRQFGDLLDEYSNLCVTIGFDVESSLRTQSFLHKVFLNRSHLRAMGLALRNLPPGQVYAVTSSLTVHTEKFLSVASTSQVSCFPSQVFLFFLSEALRQLQVTPAGAQRSLAAAVYASFGPVVSGLRVCADLSEKASSSEKSVLITVDFLNLLSAGVTELLLASWDVGIACAAQPSVLASVPSIYNCLSAQSLSSLWPLNVLVPALTEEDSSRLADLIERAAEPTLKNSDLAKALSKAYKKPSQEAGKVTKKASSTSGLPVLTTVCKWILDQKGSISGDSLKIYEGAKEAAFLACAARLRLLHALFTSNSTTSQDVDNLAAASFFSDTLLNNCSVISSTVIDLCVHYTSKGKDQALNTFSHNMYGTSLTEGSGSVLAKPWRNDLLRSARLYEIDDVPLSLIQEAIVGVRLAFWEELSSVKRLTDKKSLLAGKLSPMLFSQALNFLQSEVTQSHRPLFGESGRAPRPGIAALPESKSLERAIEAFLKLPSDCFTTLADGSSKSDEVLSAAVSIGICIPILCRGFESFISKLLTSVPGITSAVLSLEKYSKGKDANVLFDFLRVLGRAIQNSEEAYQDVVELPYEAVSSVVSAALVRELKKVVRNKKDAKLTESNDQSAANLSSMFITTSETVIQAAFHVQGGSNFQQLHKIAVLRGIAQASTRLNAALNVKKGVKAIKAVYAACLTSNLFITKDSPGLKKYPVNLLASELECAAALEIHSGKTQVRIDGPLLTMFGLISKINDNEGKLTLSMQRVLDAAYGSPLYTEISSRLLTETFFTTNSLHSWRLADHCPVAVLQEIAIQEMSSENNYDNNLNFITSIVDSAAQHHDALYFSCLAAGTPLPVGGFPGETLRSGSLAVRDSVVSLVRRALPALTVDSAVMKQTSLKCVFQLFRVIVSSPRLIPLSQSDVGLILTCLSSLQRISLTTRVALAVSSTLLPTLRNRSRNSDLTSDGELNNLDKALFEKERITSSSTLLPIDRLVIDIGRFFGSSSNSSSEKKKEAQIVTSGALFVLSKSSTMSPSTTNNAVVESSHSLSAFPDAYLLSSGAWILVGLLRHRKDAALASLPSLSQFMQALFTLALTPSTDELRGTTTGHDQRDGYPESSHIAPLVRCCELFSILVKVARYHSVNVLSRVFELLAKRAPGATLPAAGIPRVRDAIVPAIFALFDALGPRQLQQLYQLFKAKASEKALLKSLHKDYTNLTEVDLT